MIQKGKILREDLALYDGINTRESRRDSTGGTIQGNRVGGQVDILVVYGSGLDRTRTTIINAITAIGSGSATLQFTPGIWTIDDNLSIPSNFTSYIHSGAVFEVASGKTLTFNGPIQRESDNWYIGTIVYTAANNVIVHQSDLASTDSGKGASFVAGALRVINASDFGASASQSASYNTGALEAAYTAAHERGLILLLPHGRIPFESLEWNKDVIVWGYGQSILSTDTIASVLAPTGDGITITGNHAANYMNFAIDGDDQAGSNFGLLIAGAARSCFQNIAVYRCGGVGIHLLSSDPIALQNNNRACFINVRAVSNGGDGWYISGETVANNNSLAFINCSASSNGGKGWNNINGSSIHLSGLSCENNTDEGVYLGGAVRNIVGTVYVEGNGGVDDIHFDTNAHTNFLTTINDGAGYVDSNGTNSICIAGSGATQKYRFSRMDFETFRAINSQYIGGLEFAHTADRAYSLTQQSGGTGTITFRKGAGSSLNLVVEGYLQQEIIASVASTPTFQGQLAIVAGEAYIAVAASSSSDWKKITP